MSQLLAALLVAMFFAVDGVRITLWLVAAVVVLIVIMRRRSRRGKTTSSVR